MKYTMAIEASPAKEYLVLKNTAKLCDPNVTPNPNADVWASIRRRIADGTVERLKKTAGSSTLYILFCYTCVRNDNS